MFIAALFTIAKLWKQPRCPTIGEWVKKMWYLYTMEFYAAMKKNEILSFTGKILCFPSYADFRSKTNAVILSDMGHTLRGEHIQEEQGKVGNPKLQSV
jgi:hypothetical protein